MNALKEYSKRGLENSGSCLNALAYFSKYKDVFVKFNGFLTSQGNMESLHYIDEAGKPKSVRITKDSGFRPYVEDAEIKIGDTIRLRFEKKFKITGKEYLSIAGISKF